MVILVLHVFLATVFVLRVMLRDDLAADARLAWLMVIALFPVAGCVVYFLFGEVRITRQVAVRQQKVFNDTRKILSKHITTDFVGNFQSATALIESDYRAPFNFLAHISGLYAVQGNQAELMPDAQTARARMIEDIDAAQHQVNVLYYIWLNDDTGNNVAHALIRAVKRGVRCYAMVDGLGSRLLLKTALWQQMRDAGVKVAVTLPINHPLHTILTSRIDLRNHRKITLIDGKIAYCGSQNCADAAFAIKAKYAPWVDIMLRLQGPVVSQTQLLFASDWITTQKYGILKHNNKHYDINPAEFALASDFYAEGFAAQVMAAGPTDTNHSTPQFLTTLIYSAKQQLTISTPYFVPDATVLEALCATALRGVIVKMIFPRRNDSWIVAAASRSHYHKLLKSGVQIYEFEPGLLHAKTLTIDNKITFIGSTNLDLRSFDLNYENNILLQDYAITAAVFARQIHYIQASTPITLNQVEQWSHLQRLWNNTIATVGPIL